MATMRPRLPAARFPKGMFPATPRVIYEFGDYVGKELQRRDGENTHIPSGLISGHKVGQPSLWSVLDMLGELRAEHEAYTLGKFQRGHDVEARAINLLTGLPLQRVVDILSGDVPNPGWIKSDDKAVLDGEFYLQYPQGYRGGIGYIDLAQRTPNGELVLHEIKSKSKMAYDYVAATGRSAGKAPDPYLHECMQLAYYALGAGTDRAFMHYFNADDYRMITFAINPIDYKEEIDREIDVIQAAFDLKSLPPFEPLLDFHRERTYQAYGDEWNLLTPTELMNKLETEYPSAYEKLMSTTLPKGDEETNGN